MRNKKLEVLDTRVLYRYTIPIPGYIFKAIESFIIGFHLAVIFNFKHIMKN